MRFLTNKDSGDGVERPEAEAGSCRSAFELGLARGGDLSACFIDRQNNRRH